MRTVAFFICLLKISIRASVSTRGAFLIESGLMVANNLIFFTMWWIFFGEFKEVDGWDLNDMAILFAVGTGSYGLMQICFGGVRHLSQIIIQGDLDSFMTQPKNILLHIAGSKSFAKGWGHLLTGPLLIGLTGSAALHQLGLILICILSGCLVFTSMNIMAFSLPFWIGAVERVSKKYCDALYLFSLYPMNIYSGFLQVILFTLIPAGVISYLPVELLRAFSWMQLLILMASSATFFAMACLVFYAGLKRYESGNQFSKYS